MDRLEFGVWDQMQTYEVMQAATAAEVYEKHIRQAQLMERVGFEYYWTLEHQGSYVGAVTSPQMFLLAVARHTESLRLGTMIWQLPFHHPIRLAQDVAMLDHLSGGRVEFGTGIGVHEHEFMRWGLDFYSRQEMSEEALDIIELAWRGDGTVTYEGKYWQIDEALIEPDAVAEVRIRRYGQPCTARARSISRRSGAITWRRTSTRTSPWRRSSPTGARRGRGTVTRGRCRASS